MLKIIKISQNWPPCSTVECDPSQINEPQKFPFVMIIKVENNECFSIDLFLALLIQREHLLLMVFAKGKKLEVHQFIKISPFANECVLLCPMINDMQTWIREWEREPQEHAYFWGLVCCRDIVAPNCMIQNYKNDYFL